MAKHPQVELAEGIFVDVKMAPVVRELWRLGWWTFLSCQDNVPQNYAWIQFECRAGGLWFVALLFDILPSCRSFKTDVRIRFLGRKHKTCCVRFPNRYLPLIARELRKIPTPRDDQAPKFPIVED